MNKAELLENLTEGINIVDFWAEWCSPCKTLSPVLDSLNESNEDVNLIKVDVDSNSELAGEFGIRNIPSIFFLDKSGNVVDKLHGARPKSQFEAVIDKIRTR